MFAFLTGTSGSLADVLSNATELLTWLVSSMGSIVSFIVSQPLVLIPCLMFIVGFAAAFLSRIWK